MHVRVTRWQRKMTFSLKGILCLMYPFKSYHSLDPHLNKKAVKDDPQFSSKLSRKGGYPELSTSNKMDK